MVVSFIHQLRPGEEANLELFDHKYTLNIIQQNVYISFIFYLSLTHYYSLYYDKAYQQARARAIPPSQVLKI